MKNRIAIVVPGNWTAENELVAQFASGNSGFMLAGGLLRSQTSGTIFELNFLKSDPNMTRAFEIGGYGRIEKSILKSIERHRSIALVTSENAGNDFAQQILEIGTSLIRFGGIGIKVDSSGLAFAPVDWEYYCKMRFEAAALLYSFVNMINQAGRIQTCGFHCFGLPELRVDSISDETKAGLLIESCGIAMIQRSKDFAMQASTILDIHGQEHRIKERIPSNYEQTSLFYNPLGILAI